MLYNSTATDDSYKFDNPILTQTEVRTLATAAYYALLKIIPQYFMGVSREYFIEQVVLTAFCESKFNTKAVGTAGEIGLMQIKPVTARDIESRILNYKENKPLSDPYYNVLLGSGYLAYQINRYKSTDKAAWDYGIQAYQKGGFDKAEYPTPYLLNHYAKSEELYAGRNNPFADKLNLYAQYYSKGRGSFAVANNRNRLEWL